MKKVSFFIRLFSNHHGPNYEILELSCIHALQKGTIRLVQYA